MINVAPKKIKNNIHPKFVKIKDGNSVRLLTKKSTLQLENISLSSIGALIRCEIKQSSSNCEIHAKNGAASSRDGLVESGDQNPNWRGEGIEMG